MLNVTPDARKAVLVRTGTDPGTVVPLDLLDAHEDVRAVIARHVTLRDGHLNVYAHDARDITVTEVVRALLAEEAKEAADAAEKAETDRVRAVDACTHLAEALTRPMDEWLVEPSGGAWTAQMPVPADYYESHYDSYQDVLKAHPDYVARMADAAKEAERRTNQDRLNRASNAAADAAKEEAREEAEEAKQREWIGAHGSILLRGLLREGIDCDRVYRDERLKLERPGWVWESTVCGAITEIHGTSVSEEHLAALESARKIDPDVYLAWLGKGEHLSTCQCHSDDYDNPAVAQRTILAAEFLGREIVCDI